MPLKPKQAPPQRKPNVAIIASDAPAPVVFAWHCVGSPSVVGGSIALVDRRRPFGLCTGVSSVIAAAASIFSSFDAACAGHLAKFHGFQRQQLFKCIMNYRASIDEMPASWRMSSNRRPMRCDQAWRL